MISVLLPAYKSTYLSNAIESVLHQSYCDWELIIVNDKSPQPIDDVVKEYLYDSRIHYYINDENLGKKDLVANWNRCLSYAKGDYFSLICDDDIYKPTFLEEMINLSNKYPNCNVFRTGVEIIDSNENIIDYYPSSPEYESCEDYMWHVFKGYRCQTITEWFYRTSYIKNLGGFVSLPLAWYSDFLSIFIFSLKGGIVSSSKRLVQFRMSGENITSQKEKNAIKKMNASLQYENSVIEIIQNNNFVYKEMILKLLYRYLRSKRGYGLSTCNWSDWFYFVSKNRFYHLDNKMIVKSFINRFI